MQRVKNIDISIFIVPLNLMNSIGQHCTPTLVTIKLNLLTLDVDMVASWLH